MSLVERTKCTIGGAAHAAGISFRLRWQPARCAARRRLNEKRLSGCIRRGCDMWMGRKIKDDKTESKRVRIYYC